MFDAHTKNGTMAVYVGEATSNAHVLDKINKGQFQCVFMSAFKPQNASYRPKCRSMIMHIIVNINKGWICS